MKKLAKLTIAAVLTTMLAASAFAGDIGIPGAPPPPQNSSSSTAPGDIEMPGYVGTPPSDTVADVALNLLQAVLSIF